MDSMTLAEAKVRRGHIRATATRLKSFIEAFDPLQGSRHDVAERKKKLTNLWDQFDSMQSRIEVLENEDPANADKEALLAQQVQQRTNFETPYFNLISRYETVIELFERREAPASPSHEINASMFTNRESRIKLPKIELPVFSGSYDDWYSYQDTFEKLIHSNNSLSEIEKFHYLRSSLKGKAAEIIKSIETTTDNYNEAWAAVKERFDNKRWIVKKHINAIFDAPALSKENHINLRELLDTILKHLRALKAIKRPTEAWDDLIIHIVISKLDSTTSKAWETSIPDKEVPNLKSLTDFLSKRCQALEAISGKLSNNNQSNNMFPNKSKGSLTTNVAVSSVSCPQCKGNHPIYFCEAFLQLSVENRVQAVKKAHLCSNCLRSTSHQAKSCSSGSCRKCHKKHNTLIHLAKSADDKIQSNSEGSVSSGTEKTEQPIVTQCVSAHRSLSTLLSTALIHVYDSEGQVHDCRILLDSGSQLNFITDELTNKLHLKERSAEISISGIAHGSIQAQKVVNVRIKSRFNSFNENVQCIILPKIIQQLPQRHISRSSITIPKHIKLADPNFNVPDKIDMLIGADLFWRLMCAGQIISSRTQPTLQKTHLGWVISGATTGNIIKSCPSATSCLAVTEDLNRALSRFWEVEHITSSAELSPEEQACERLFKETVKRNRQGRFIVQLPIKQEELINLGESKETAMRRFKALEKRLTNSSQLYEEYKGFIQEYLELGHMREVLPSEPAPMIQSYYMPHHAVYKHTSTTTKLRVVFDGSCKTTTGMSLNDSLMVGPTIQDDLFSILTRYRTFKYALTADIAKMYRQVLVDPGQTSLQRILWRNSAEEPIRTFELLTLTYGTASAAFLAIRTLRKLAEDNISRFPIGSRVALNDFYVDDLVTGADTLQEALAIQSETSQLLQEGQFELRKWASNDPTLQTSQSTINQKEFVLSCDKECETRTLGLVWNCNSDQFKFSSINSLPPLTAPTKRSILSRISLIFDPLGLLGPSTLIAKIIMQDLWRLSIDWDESLPLDVHTKWKRYEIELPALNNISLPRRVITVDKYTALELHGFSDASELAYGACIYLRATTINGEHSTHLLCSKNRVAPLKSLSIPRLELCAALLLAQLVDKVLKALKREVQCIYLWTDSTVVLAWLQSFSRAWTPFVAHRVGQIQQLTAIQDWHHISGQDNSADPVSRGVMPGSLQHLNIWWSGPSWLALDKEDWPQFPYTIAKENIPETKTAAIATVATQEEQFNIFTRFSNFLTLVRVVAYIYRFFKKVKQNSKPSSSQHPVLNTISTIQLDEISNATQVLIKLVQKSCFPKELHSLSSQQSISKNSLILKLNPFLDDSGILRVGGRLQQSHLPYSAKHQILLPGRHPLSRLIVMHEHQRHFHAGPQATLAAVRQAYWLISARDVVRQIIRKCVICFRSSPKPTSALMGSLPESRIVIPGRPFEKCGVDYAGPFYHKDGSRKTAKFLKCYIAIFICFATKAVHIELAMDLSTEAFLNVLKRFISRRGCPSDIYSDNGLNFVGANHELKELATLFSNQAIQRQIVDYMTIKKINWHFIPPRAPHHGGIWEAAVKSAKRHLVRVTKDAHLKYEELETLLVQIEAIMNSRPLTPMSSDPADLTSLTAGHFLIGTPLTSYPEPSLEELPINRLSRWQHVEQLRQHFWRRWSREYLHQCQGRSKWKIQKNPIHTGQLVILQEDNAPPMSWPLARIVEVHPGKDDIIRTVTVRTNKGIYKRPITRLCLFPFQDD